MESATAPAPAAPAASSDDGGAQRLDDVVVTAQKKTQSLQKVPVSVGVVGGATLRDAGAFDAGEIQRFVPNIQIDSDPQAPVIGIRGFTTETDNVGFDPSVGLVIDDLALARPEFVADGMFDIDRIEVLRGSQGTLFGKNTIAGVVNFFTTEPQDHFGLSASSSFGRPLQRRDEAAIDVPLGEDFSMRLAGVAWDRRGDVENETLNRRESSSEQRAGRFKLAGHAGDGWKISLSGQMSETQSLYAPWQLDSASPEALTFARKYDASTEDDPLDSHTTENLPGFADRHSDLERVLMEYQQGDLWGLRDVAYTVVAGRAAFHLRAMIDTDASAADLINTDFRNAEQQNSVELRAAGLSDSLFGLGEGTDWVLGLYAARSDLQSHLDTLAGQDLVAFALSASGQEALGVPSFGLVGPILDQLPQLPGVPLRDQVLRGFNQATDSLAGFGQMTWHVAGGLSAIVGARYGQDRKSADFDVQRVGLGIVALVVGASPFTAQLERDETFFSPKAGLQYEWNEQLMTFVTWTRGFKSGGFNATADDDTNLQFEPEQADSWEAGIKSRFFGRSLTLNATAYRSDVKDLQVVDFTGTSFKVSNAAVARLQGVELDLRWLPGWNWLAFNGAVALAQAKYLSYPNAPPAPEQTSDTQDLTGRTLAHAPTVTASLSPEVTLPLAWGVGMKLAVDANYRGHQYSSTDLDSHTYQAGYTLLGARLAIAPEGGQWALFVNGSNLTNRRALALVTGNPVYGGTYIADEVIPLRSWTAGVRISLP